jgi:bifunctional non-homologous end joining protein LigD
MVRLRSLKDKDFNRKYSGIAKALAALPDETGGRWRGGCFWTRTDAPHSTRCRTGAPRAGIFFYVFDVMILAGGSVMGEPLATRRDLLTREVMTLLADPVREAPRFDAALADLIAAVRSQGLEGLVAKRLDSVYEPGARSGAWRKMRFNRSQEFVIGGYTRGGRAFDALVLGQWDGGDWLTWRGRGLGSHRRAESG